MPGTNNLKEERFISARGFRGSLGSTVSGSVAEENIMAEGCGREELLTSSHTEEKKDLGKKGLQTRYSP